MDILLISYLVVSIALIGIILLQQGKGAEMGASFGSGASNTVFGAAGSGNVLTKTTTILAILFFVIALTISFQNQENVVVKDDILDETTTTEQSAVEEIDLESELPTVDGGIESETAPIEKDAVADDDTPKDEKTTTETTENNTKKEEKKNDSNKD